MFEALHNARSSQQTEVASIFRNKTQEKRKPSNMAHNEQEETPSQIRKRTTFNNKKMALNVIRRISQRDVWGVIYFGINNRIKWSLT